MTGGSTAGTGGVLASQGPGAWPPPRWPLAQCGGGGLGGASFRPQLLAQVGLGEMTTEPTAHFRSCLGKREMDEDDISIAARLPVVSLGLQCPQHWHSQLAPPPTGAQSLAPGSCPHDVGSRGTEGQAQ